MTARGAFRHLNKREGGKNNSGFRPLAPEGNTRGEGKARTFVQVEPEGGKDKGGDTTRNRTPVLGKLGLGPKRIDCR